MNRTSNSDSSRNGHHHRKKRSSRSSYLGTGSRDGVAIQCQFCIGQSFRRSSLRLEDLTQLFLMRYPVRCLRCNRRQLVSFTVAGISLSSKTKPRRRRRTTEIPTGWTEPISGITISAQDHTASPHQTSPPPA
jgi:hypothetical protein